MACSGSVVDSQSSTFAPSSPCCMNSSTLDMFTPPQPGSQARVCSTSETVLHPRRFSASLWSGMVSGAKALQADRSMSLSLQALSRILHTSNADLVLPLVSYFSVLVDSMAASGLQPLPMRSFLCHCASEEAPAALHIDHRDTCTVLLRSFHSRLNPHLSCRRSPVPIQASKHAHRNIGIQPLQSMRSEAVTKPFSRPTAGNKPSFHICLHLCSKQVLRGPDISQQTGNRRR